MAVLKTTSPVAWSGAPAASPSKRVPSSRSKKAPLTAKTEPGKDAGRSQWSPLASPRTPDGEGLQRVSRSLDQPLYLLELVGARGAHQLEQRGLDAGDDRPGGLQLVKPNLAVLLGARGDRVARHVHLEALLKEIVRGLRDAHVALDAAHERLLAALGVEAVRAGRGEADLLDRLHSVEGLGELGHRVAEP